MTYYYIFYKDKGDNVYERTTQSENRAKERVEELKKLYEDAEYFENEIPKDYEYFY